MPRRSSPKIHKIVLYEKEYILDDNGNRTDENRPSKKDPRVRKNKRKFNCMKKVGRKKKKHIFQEKNTKFGQIGNLSGSFLIEPNNLNHLATNDKNESKNIFNNLNFEDYEEFDFDDEYLFEYADKPEFN